MFGEKFVVEQMSGDSGGDDVSVASLNGLHPSLVAALLQAVYF